MKKNNLFRRISFVMSFMLILMLLSPGSFSVYAGDDPVQPVAAENVTADTPEEGIPGTETSTEDVEETADEAELTADSEEDLQEQAPEAPDEVGNAEESEEESDIGLLAAPEDANEEGVARIGDVYYASLADAVSAAQAGDTIVMVGDEELTGSVSIRKNVTIDLNGHEISANFSGAAIVLPFAQDPTMKEVTITDTSEGGNGAISNTGSNGRAVDVEAYGTLNVEGGTLHGNGAGVNLVSWSNCTVNVKDGTVEGGPYGIRTNGTTNIEGGKVHGYNSGIMADRATPGPNIKISGGEVSSDDTSEMYAGVRMNNGDLLVTGGTIYGNVGILVNGHVYGSTTYTPTAEVNGGAIKGSTHSISNENSAGEVDPSRFLIGGGKYSDDIGNSDDYMRPEGRILLDDDSDGLYELATPVAKRVVDGEDVLYGTLQKAFNAAAGGDTVYVIADITLTERAAIRGKTVNLDLGDYTITNDDSFDTSRFGNSLIFVSHGEGSDAGLTLTGDGGKLVSTNGMAVWLESGTRPADGYANFTMDTVTIEADTCAVYTNGNYSTITIDSGTIHSAKNGPGGDSSGAIYAGGRSTVTINGGTITNDAGTALTVNSPTVIINGGTLTGGTYGINMVSTATGRVTVEDGVIIGGDASIKAATPSRFTINGGVYSDSAGNADGYVRKDDKMLIKGANGEYPDMFALGDAVASIERDGETILYPTLAAAVADAKAGETVKMIDDEELTGPVSIKKDLTIDLNGHEVSANFGGAAIIIPWGDGATNNKEVTITDTSDAGDGAIRNETGSAVQPQANATLNVKGGELYGNRSGIEAPSAYATINVEDGTVEGGQYGIEATGGKVNVTDGTIKGTYAGILGGLGSPAPDIKVSGGSISASESSAGYSGIRLRGGKVEMTGGTVSGGTGILVESFNWGSSDQVSAAEVSGGTVTGSAKSVDIQDSDGIKSEFKISGGEYSDDIGNGDDYTRPPHQHLQQDGEYYVLKPDPRSEVTIEIGEGHEAVAEGWAAYLEDNAGDLDIDEITVDGTTVKLDCYDMSLTIGELQLALADVLNDYMGSADMPGPRAGEHNKELISGLGALGQKPIDQYSDFGDVTEEIEASTDTIPDEQTYYALWEKPVTSIEVTVEAPTCGTEVTAESASDREGQDPKPSVSLTSENAHVTEAYWASSKSGQRDDVFSGTLTAEDGAIVRIAVARDFGYYFSTEYLESITVNGETVAAADITGSSVGLREFYFDITIEHDPGDPVQENLVEPTGSRPGSYDEVVYCNGCGTELSRKTIEIPAVTYEVTEGDGSVWTRGSSEDLNFTIERSYKDEETFERYVEIRVDGETLDTADYEAEAGSLKVALKADYLEGLAVGDHTLTGVFNDGEADAVFTIAEEDVTPGGDGEDKDKDGTPDDDEDGTPGDDEDGTSDGSDEGQGPKTGDESNVAIWLLLMSAAASTIMLVRRRRS